MHKRNITVGALTDHLHTPSSRFRIRQFIDKLKNEDIIITDYPRKYSKYKTSNFLPNKRIRESFLKMFFALIFEIANYWDTFIRLYFKASKYDYIFISREIIDNFFSFEFFIPDNVIFDLDDAIFNNGFFYLYKTKLLVKSSKVVFVPTTYIADWCKQYSNNVHVVPTVVDIDRFIATKKFAKKEFIVGWSGTSSNYRYLLLIEDYLFDFFSKNINTKLKICSDRYPHELKKLKNHIIYEKWTVDNEVNQIQSFDIGIVPMQKEEYALGKGSYKMLLCLSCNIPCCVTDWGTSKEIINRGKVGIAVNNDISWLKSLQYLFNNRSKLNILFPDCRKVVEKYYSTEVVIKKYKKVLMQIKFA